MNPFTQIKQHGFVISLFLSVFMAYFFPWLGVRGGPLQAEILGKAGVLVIFLLQGLSLQTGELLRGFRNWRLHMFIQSWIFLLTPLIFSGGAIILNMLGQPQLARGFLFLALLPTTISSAVVLSTAAEGNVAAAIFNTTLSNVWGVVWVPLGCLILFSIGGSLETGLIGSLLWKLTCLILLPLLAGQVIRPLIAGNATFKAMRPFFKTINNFIIVFIVFAAFCQSFSGESWSGFFLWELLLLGTLVGVCVLLIHALVWITAKRMFQDLPSRITALFCGSQKTLASGVPMALAIFDNSHFTGTENLGLILLPLMIYHPLQLLFAALLIPRLKMARSS